MAQKDDGERVRQLEEEVGHLRTMLASAPNFVMRISLDGRVLYSNRLAPGFDIADVLGAPIDGFIPTAHRDRVHAALERAVATGKVQAFETMGATGPDSMGHYLCSLSPVSEGGEVTSLVLVSTDVTDLHESRTRLQLVLDATEMGIWSYDPARGGGDWDAATRRIFGVDEDEAAPDLQVLLASRLHPEDAPMVAAGLESALTTGVYPGIEHRVVHGDGSVHWVAASGVAVRGADGSITGVVGGVREITERRLLEERLHRAEKLQSIGRLAGGIAHDFNNMLTTILGNVELAGDEVDEGSAFAEHLEEIRLAADRSAALTAQLLAFARKQMIEPRSVDPNALVSRLDALLRRVLGEHIEVVVELGSTGGIEVDPSQLEQVLLNLVTNARDAMAGGGRVTLSTSDVSLSEADVRSIPEAIPGNYVQILVSDTGTGIPSEILPHVFEPFFSSRTTGTGLGLATCYGIVAQNGGHIDVRSSSAGASFFVRLPRNAAVVGVEPKSASKVGEGRGESVLVVEDEPLVRGVLEQSLRRGGYAVTVAENPAAALRLLAQGSGPYRMLVTDIAMPGMDGWTLAERLGAAWPGLAVLFISGYAQDAKGSDGVLKPGLRYLQKPFLPRELLDAVHDALAEA